MEQTSNKSYRYLLIFIQEITITDTICNTFTILSEGNKLTRKHSGPIETLVSVPKRRTKDFVTKMPCLCEKWALFTYLDFMITYRSNVP